MARRHNNWGGSSYGVIGGSNVRSSSPDGVWNRRGPFINLVEGSPAPFSDNRYLLPEYFLDEGECSLDIPFSANQLQVSPFFAPADEFVSTVTTIVEDDAAVLVAPGAVRGATFFAAEDELPTAITTIVDDSEPATPVVPPLRLVAMPASTDDELSFVTADDDSPAAVAPAWSPLLRITTLFAPEDQLTPIVDDEAVSALLIGATRASAELFASEDQLSFVIDDSESVAPAVPPPRLVSLPAALDDEITPIIDDEAVSALAVGRLLTVADLFAPGDEPSFVTADDETFAPAVLWSVPASADFATPDEGLSPVGDDEPVFTPPLLRLVPAIASTAPEDEAAFPTHDDDSPLALLARAVVLPVETFAPEDQIAPIIFDDEAVALVAPYKLPTADLFFDVGDELAPPLVEEDASQTAIVGRLLRVTDLPFADPGELPGTVVPPKPRRHFVPTIGVVSTGGGWQLPNGEEVDGGEPDPGVWIGREAAFDFEEWEESESTPGFAARATQLPIGIVAGTLEVQVRATMLNVITVERGNLVYFIAPFTGVPEEVYFSYMAPGSERPIVDSGWPKPNSKIRRIKIEEAIALGFDALEGYVYYVYVVDTTGMCGGILKTHFWGTGKHKASAFPKVRIPDEPRQLL